MEEGLGRLVRTLKERCPECKHPMQLRARKITSLVRGIETVTEEEYKSCSSCDYEVEIPLRDRKKRVEHFDKTRYVPEKKEVRNKNNGYKKSK